MNFLNYILGIPSAFAQVSDKSTDVAGQTTNELAKFVASFLEAIPLWIVAIIVAFASYLVAIALRRSIELKLSKEGIEEEHREVQIIAGRATFFGTLTLGITIALSIVGIDLKPIVAAGAFGLGFALQDIIMNLISGVMILASRHFTIGDVISVNGITGRVMEIQTRATIIKDFDGLKVIVPNSELFGNVVISKTSNPFRKLTFIQGVGYGTDLKKVMELTLAVVNCIPWVLKKPKASVAFTEWDDSWIDFKIKVWIDAKGGKMMKVKNRVMMDLTKAYEEAGIYIPYPIQTVQFENTPKGWTEDEIDQEKVTNTMKGLKDKYREKALSGEQKLALVSPATVEAAPSGQSWLQNAFKEVSHLTSPDLAPALETAPAAPIYGSFPQTPTSPSAPAPQPPPVPSVNPPVSTLPIAPNPIPPGVNNEGQSWLQQAMQSQLAQFTPTPSTPPAEPSTILIPPTNTAMPQPSAPAEASPTMNSITSMPAPTPSAGAVIEPASVMSGPAPTNANPIAPANQFPPNPPLA